MSACRPFSEPNAYGGRATRDKKTRELRMPTAASGGLYRILTVRLSLVLCSPPLHDYFHSACFCVCFRVR